jgi:hypothetical protein
LVAGDTPVAWLLSDACCLTSAVCCLLPAACCLLQAEWLQSRYEGHTQAKKNPQSAGFSGPEGWRQTILRSFA